MEEFQRLPRFTRKMILYSSTNFRSLKPGAIISNFIRFDLVFWKTSKPFYRKLKYRQKVLEEFRRLPRFPRKMVLYSSTNFCSLKPWAIISNLIRFDLGFWQARNSYIGRGFWKSFNDPVAFPEKWFFYWSTNLRILKPCAIISNLIRFHLGFWQPWKPFYRKLKYREKVLEEFQRLSRFPRKMILYSSTNFRILKPWAIISNLIRFDLGFWQASKPFYRKLKYREKVLEDFQRLPGFPRKILLYSSTSFCILKPWAIIFNLIRFVVGFWQASKPFIRKLKYRENVLKKFQRLSRFPRKFVLYSSTNICILKPWAIILNLRRFDFGCWEASKPFYRKLKYRENVLEEFQRLPRFLRKFVLCSSTNIPFESLEALFPTW